MKRYKVGIIGAGSISHLHTANYLKNSAVKVVAVCDINTERAAAYAEKYAIPHVYSDYRDMLAQEEIDAVSVTTWNNSHAEISIAAMRAGKDVLCEKPLAMNAAEAGKMVATAEETGRLLMVGFVRRFEDNPNYLKEGIERGDFGDIYYAKTGYVRKWGNPGGWFSDKARSGGGPVIDIGVHVIDLVRYIMGNPAALSVSASAFDKLGMLPGIRGMTKYYSDDYDPDNILNDVEDAACALIRFENDATLFFETSWTLHTKEDHNYLDLFGEKAGARMEPELEVYGVDNAYFTATRPSLPPREDVMSRIFTREIDHFIDCLAGKAVCRCPAEDGLEMMKILDAVYESARTGREVVIA